MENQQNWLVVLILKISLKRMKFLRTLFRETHSNHIKVYVKLEVAVAITSIKVKRLGVMVANEANNRRLATQNRRAATR